MADKEHIQKKGNAREDAIKAPTDFEIGEEELTEEGSFKLYTLLFQSTSNPKKKEFVKEALERFPHPDKSTDIEIDL